jgi:hypothetical protein
MAAAKFLDATSCFDDMDGEESDASGAYTQSTLGGPKTWISLPKNRWPKSWIGKYTDPVVELRLSLYGHPLAGLYWEKHSKERIISCGFKPVPSWECLYYHEQKQLFLSVYVDDYKLAGKKDNIKPMWKALMASGLDLDPPTPLCQGVYLGCSQTPVEVPQSLLSEKEEFWETITGTKPLVAESQQQPLKENKEATVSKPKPTTKPTPQPPPKKSGKLSKMAAVAAAPKVRAWEYYMGHAQGCVDRYLEFSGLKESSLKQVSTPCIDDHLISPEDEQTKGLLSDQAARMVLKVLYLARIKRLDLLYSVNVLARDVTRWTVACDKRLHRLISYVNHTKDWSQCCFVGDRFQDCILVMFADAGFAGCLASSKSTSGGILCLVGKRTFVPLTWICKKQTAISHSSAEAEVIALDAAVRMEGIPCLTLWSTILKVFTGKGTNEASASKPPSHAKNPTSMETDMLSSIDYVTPNIDTNHPKARLMIMEDNDGVIKMCIKGRSPNMRHVGRTHRVDLDWLFERIREDPGISIQYINTKGQIADIFTKGQFTADQ